MSHFIQNTRYSKIEKGQENFQFIRFTSYIVPSIYLSSFK